MEDMYDEKGMLKEELALTEKQKRAMMINNNINIIDNRTDFGKGIYFKSKDGHEHASMEDVRIANQQYFDQKEFNTSNKYLYSAKLEKAYFDSITATFSIDDKNVQQFISKELEDIMAFIKERYKSYLIDLSEQQSYGQDNNKNPKR